MDSSWETDLADLLGELSSTQQELLGVLDSKRQLLAKSDVAGLDALRPREQALVERLQACHRRRGELLQRAEQQGLPSQNLRSLTAALPLAGASPVRAQLNEAQHRSRLLQHQSLASWVLVQRTLIHLSQLLEIIATSGRSRPTYGRGEPVNSSGSLVDRAA